MYLSRRAPTVPVIPPSISIKIMCISSLCPPTPLAYSEVPGLGATLIHLTPGRYSRSVYSSLTDDTVMFVEFVSCTTSAAANSILSLLRATSSFLSIVTLTLQVFVPCVITWLSAMIPVTPPLGSPISNFLLAAS